VSLSALDRQNFALCRLVLVRRREHALVEEDLSHTHLESIARSIVGRTLLAIKESLGSDIFQRVVELSVWRKDCVERVYMRVDRRRQRRVCGLIGRRIAEEGVSSEGVEVGAPFAFDLLRRAHLVEGMCMHARVGVGVLCLGHMRCMKDYVFVLE
jgi:hypothetical protein